MASATLVPLAEYLQAANPPDREWAGGELKERHVGKFSHSTVQAEVRTVGDVEPCRRTALDVGSAGQRSAYELTLPGYVVCIPLTEVLPSLGGRKGYLFADHA